MKKYLLLIFVVSISFNSYSQIPELWGTMSIGGSFGIGGIFKINGDGSGYQMDYNCAGGINGGSIQSNLLPRSSYLIYGNSVSGGNSAKGDIFKYNPATNNYTMLFAMDTLSGYYPRGPIVNTSSSNLLFGMTNNGGTQDFGVFWEYNLNTNTYTKRHDFDNSTGKYPNGGVMQSSVNNKIYGMTTSGGANSIGVIFSYDIPSTTFTIVHDFAFATGASAFGTLMQASNNLLYGMAFGGGSTGYGVIFSFDPTNSNYNVVHTFDGTNGAAPTSQLFEEGGILYGCTSQGGTNNKGIIFKYETAIGIFTKLHDFDVATGASPNGNVMMASDGKLYGMTQSGGANNLGTIYSYDLSNNQYTKIYDGSFATGGYPYADLIEYSGATTVNEIKNNETAVVISPNPSNGNITIQINNFKGETALTITNVIGQEVLRFPITSSTITKEIDLDPGMYFYSTTNNTSSSFTGRLIVE